ncbi:MAG: phosphatase PAP2 family protein [Shewanellaceae bacterium]|nr:phosphatase PAP2 family protein [Shewanellaceae bacterium]
MLHLYVARIGLIATLLLASNLAASETDYNDIFTSDTSSFRTFGDYTMVWLPGAALGYSLIIGDVDGAWQLTLGTGITQVMSESLKSLTHRTRPDGHQHTTSHKSFPSGHTAAAFSGASYLHHRYGWQLGLPGYILASLVGASRIAANKHHLDDVTTSINLAVFNSLYLTEPDNAQRRWWLLPQFDTSNMGAMWVWNYGDQKEQRLINDHGAKPYTYDFSIANLYQTTHHLQGASHQLNLDDTIANNSNTITSRLYWQIAMTDQQAFRLSFQPLETRGQITPDKTQIWDEFTLDADVAYRYSYRLYDLTSVYAWQISSMPWYNLALLAGVRSQFHSVRLGNARTQAVHELQQWSTLPIFGTEVTLRLHPQWQVQGQYENSVWKTSAERQGYQVRLNYQPDSTWQFGIQHGWVKQNSSLSQHHHTLSYRIYSIRLGYRF